MPLEEARASGAIGLFADRYGDEVSVYRIGDVSLEFCGGPHVNRTSEIGRFQIKKEQSSSAGVRRIRAQISKALENAQPLMIFEGAATTSPHPEVRAYAPQGYRELVAAIPAKIISTPAAERAEWRLDTKKLPGCKSETEAVMRVSVQQLFLALTTVAFGAPAHALSGPVPGAKLQNAGSHQR